MPDETTPSPDMDDLITRLDVVEARLAALSRVPYPVGLGDPDPGGEERWDAARVWAHMCEILPYWTAEARRILEAGGAAGAASAEPILFGRLKDNPTRVNAVEEGRLQPRETLGTCVQDGIAGARAYFSSLSPADLDREAQHQVRGPKPVSFIFDEFVVKHLEEHANQLDRLAARAGKDEQPTAD